MSETILLVVGLLVGGLFGFMCGWGMAKSGNKEENGIAWKCSKSYQPMCWFWKEGYCCCVRDCESKKSVMF